MKPELSPGFGVRKAGRPDSAGSTSMAIRRSASEPISQTRQRDHVGGEGDRLGVEVAARQRLVGLREDQRIVGDAVRLGRQRGRAPGAACRAPRPSPAAGSAGSRGPARARRRPGARRGWRRPGHQRAQRVGRLDLAAAGGAARGCAGRTARPSPCAASVESAPVTSAERNSDLRLEQRRPARRRWRTACRSAAPGPPSAPSVERREAGGMPAPRRRHAAPPAMKHLADADHRRGHVRERREVAGGADRALRRDRPA